MGDNGSSIWSNVGSAATPIIQGIGAGASASQVANANANAASQVENAATAGTGLLNPYATTGSSAETQLANLYGLNGSAAESSAQGTFQNTPGFQFTQQMGDQAIQRQASATGGEFSSATLGALSNYNTGLAQQTYQNYVNNLYGLVQPGASAAAASGNLGVNAATQAGKFQVAQGQASASGIQGVTGALTNAIPGLFGSSGPFGSGGGGGGGGIPIPGSGVGSIYGNGGTGGGAMGDNPYLSQSGGGMTYDPGTGLYSTNDPYAGGTVYQAGANGEYTGMGGNYAGLSGGIDPTNGVFIANPLTSTQGGGPGTYDPGEYSSYYSQ